MLYLRSQHRSAASTIADDEMLRSTADIAVESTIDSRAVKLKTDVAALVIAEPDLAQRRKFLALFQGRLDPCRAEDDADMVAAGAIDRIPQRADFLGRHPVLRVQEHHRIDLARGKAV